MDSSSFVPTRILLVDPGDRAAALASDLREARDGTTVVVVDGVAPALDALDPSFDCVLTRPRVSDGDADDVIDRVHDLRPYLPILMLVGEGAPEPSLERPGADRAGDTTAAAPIDRLDVDGDLDPDRLLERIDDALDEATFPGPEVVDADGMAGRGEHEWKADLLDEIFERIPVHMYVKDADTRHVLVTEATFPAADRRIGKTDPEVGTGSVDRKRQALADDRHVLETGEPIIDKEEHYPDLGYWLLTSKVPWTDRNGTVVGLIGVTRDITDRKEAELALERQNERLDQFTSMVTHDLRTPISVALGYLEEARSSSDPEQHLDHVEQSLHRMDVLVEDLLKLARSGASELDPEPVSTTEVASRAWASVDGAGTLETLDPPEPILADPERLRQVFENLFENATRHGPASAGEPITIRVGRLQADAEGFYVEDDGRGLPEHVDVFDDGVTTADDGTGYGLSIVQEIATIHGWDLEATEAEAGGARFEFAGITTP